MSPSNADFSQIHKLMEIQRLYEEQETRWQQRLAEKDEEIDGLKQDLEYREKRVGSQAGAGDNEEIQRLKEENKTLRADAQAKINQLQERIKELNTKLMKK